MTKKQVIKVCAKWILAGEYAVLRGRPALSFPLPSHFIEIKWKDSPTGCFQLNTKKSNNKIKIAFKNILNIGLKQIGLSPKDLPAQALVLNANMYFGKGLGASAVLCVLIGRLFQSFKWLNSNNLFAFCHALENKLHGQSSGLDIASVLKGKPLLYQKTKLSYRPLIQGLKLKWKPFVFLSCPVISSSSICTFSTEKNIQKINLLWKTQPNLASKLNKQMEEAVHIAKAGLLNNLSQIKRLEHLCQSFSVAENCFIQWGLVGKDMKKHIDFLKNKGALATKPTGSGGAGFVLSLWKNSPPSKLKLLSAFI